MYTLAVIGFRIPFRERLTFSPLCNIIGSLPCGAEWLRNLNGRLNPNATKNMLRRQRILLHPHGEYLKQKSLDLSIQD